jgi:hypothetical protein
VESISIKGRIAEELPICDNETVRGYEFPLFSDFHKSVCSDDCFCHTLAASKSVA